MNSKLQVQLKVDLCCSCGSVDCHCVHSVVSSLLLSCWGVGVQELWDIVDIMTCSMENAQLEKDFECSNQYSNLTLVVNVGDEELRVSSEIYIYYIYSTYIDVDVNNGMT